VQRILDRVREGGRVGEEEALLLLREADLHDLGEAAFAVRMRLHPEPVVTYIVDRNINYTNICITDCSFCAFYRRPGAVDGYVLTREELARKIDETVALGGVQILLQGGHHPHLKIEWYEDLLRWIRARWGIHLHAFSPPEIMHIAAVSRLSVRQTLERLKAAGLATIPGGGAEILVDRVRRQISPKKITSEEWIGVMREAHRLGIRSSATMVIGHVETLEDRVEHLRRLRDLQDETGGFTAFIVWTMQTPRTGLAHLPTRGGPEYLRMLAVARIYLDNIPNFQSSWVTQGAKIGQLALWFGANDMGSTMLEENVVSQAGADFRMPESEIRRLIEDAGFLPRRRNTYYEVIERMPVEPPHPTEGAVDGIRAFAGNRDGGFGGG
jgi:cyclic dehypoxanthinyl futalosine synthase